MRALLDTHTFLWWITDDAWLSAGVRDVVVVGNELLFSAASGWEIDIKAQLGRLDLPTPLDRFVVEQLATNGFAPLPIRLEHALRVNELPNQHRDPFDRILIAQAQAEGLPILSADPQIARYDVQVIW